jgi:hypothetical protein
MQLFPIQTRAEFTILKKAVTHVDRVWDKEIKKFKCPVHLLKAKAYIFAEQSPSPKDCRLACIEACCEEFANFCLDAVRTLLNSGKARRANV